MSSSDLVTTSAIQIPRIEIDWPALTENRPAVLAHTDMPAYLLKPEIHRLLDACRDDSNHLLINTLWHTGARISECLALTPQHFELVGSRPYVSLKTLKGRGRPSKNEKKARLLPLTDEAFRNQVARYIRSHSIPRRSRIFPFNRGAAWYRIKKIAGQLSPELPVEVSPHTFRHSFAVNAVFHGIPLSVLNQWLGHANIENTLIYSQVLALETWHLMQRIEF